VATTLWRSSPTQVSSGSPINRFSEAAAGGRALVTANIKDFVPLDAQYKAAGRQHAGLVLVSTKTFPRDRTLLSGLTDALDVLLTTAGGIGPDRVVFLGR
jgi:hypothetical protein